MSEHKRDHMGICTGCGKGLTASELIDGASSCAQADAEPMSDREELIGRAGAAYKHAWMWGTPAGPEVDYDKRFRAGIEAVLDVFETFDPSETRAYIDGLHGSHVIRPLPEHASSSSAHAPSDDEQEEEHQAQMMAFETAKLEARNSMRHDPRVWHEALEYALRKVLPAVWSAAAGFRRTVQDEPSDAAVDAATQCWVGSSYAGEIGRVSDRVWARTRERMRAALRAAGVVTEQGEKP